MLFGIFGRRRNDGRKGGEDEGPDERTERILEMVARASMDGGFWRELWGMCFEAMEEKGEDERAREMTNRILAVLAEEDVCLGTSLMSLFSAILLMLAGAAELSPGVMRLVERFAGEGDREEEKEPKGRGMGEGRMIWFVGDVNVPEG